MAQRDLTPLLPASTAARARRRKLVRRRRAGAVAAILGVVVVLTLITSGGGHPTPAVNNTVHRGSTNPTANGRTPASDSLLKRENVAIDRLLSRQPFITSGGAATRDRAHLRRRPRPLHTPTT